MVQLRTLIAAPLLTVAMISAAGCSGNNPQVEPTPTPPSSSSPSSTQSAPASEPGGPPVDWEDSYTTEELSAYEAALSRWKRYQQAVEPIDAAGKYTTEAEELYREYIVTWQTSVIQLRDAEKAGVRVEVPPEPIWTIADSVEIKADGSGTVVLRQCTDYSKVRVTKDGIVTEEGLKPEHVVTPILIQMVTLDGKWKYVETTIEDKTSCAA